MIYVPLLPANKCFNILINQSLGQSSIIIRCKKSGSI